jgi:hypothetical protein
MFLDSLLVMRVPEETGRQVQLPEFVRAGAISEEYRRASLLRVRVPEIVGTFSESDGVSDA